MHYENFKKQFGQNFINHIPTVLYTVDAMELEEGEIVFEIGPGDGRFTDAILETGAIVELIEIDSELIDYLHYKYKDIEGLNINHSDVLEFDFIKRLEELQNEYGLDSRPTFKIFGALPYNISKKIIANILGLEVLPVSATFVLQHEVAEDYAALPPKATFISNFARLYADVEYLIKIENVKFQPIPKVHSGAVQFSFHENYLDLRNQDFIKFIKNGFRNPRKKAINSLKSIYTEIDWKQEFETNNLPQNMRAAEFTLENWHVLYTVFLSSKN